MNICFIIGSDYVFDDKDFDFSLFDVDEDEEQNAPLTSEPLTLPSVSVSRNQKPTTLQRHAPNLLSEVIVWHMTVHLGWVNFYQLTLYSGPLNIFVSFSRMISWKAL